MRNNLLSDCAPILKLIVQLRQQQDISKENVLRALDDWEQSAVSQAIPAADIQTAKYALAAFIDEAILASQWSEREAWQRNTLQLQWFGEHLAGEGFFKKLEELRLMAEEKFEILELYYLCLQLGFKGKYRQKNEEALKVLQADLFRQMKNLQETTSQTFTFHLLDKNVVKKKPHLAISYWVGLSMALAGILMIHLLFIFLIHQQTTLADQKLNHVRELG